MSANETRMGVNPMMMGVDDDGADLVSCDSVGSLGTGIRFRRRCPQRGAEETCRKRGRKRGRERIPNSHPRSVFKSAPRKPALLPATGETPGAPWGLDAGKGNAETRVFSLPDPDLGYTYILK